MRFNFSNNAFTLAEVLITLGIIGVVASLTLPTLIQNHKQQVRMTKIAKIQSILSQAALQMANDNGGTLAGICSTDEDHDCFAEKLLQYLKYTKYCKSNSEENFCKNLTTANIRPRIVLEDGFVLRIYMFNSDCSPKPDDEPYLDGLEKCVAFTVYINGVNKTKNTSVGNIVGFTMLKNSKLLPWGTPGLFSETYQYNAEKCYGNSTLSGSEPAYCTYCYISGDCKK